MDGSKEISLLNIDDVLPNRFQPRIKFSEKNILELADSIREHGVLQPIVVRKISDKYEIIAGERRYKASILAGKTTIPAIITDFDDKQSAEVALIENVQRQDLTPIEEAVSYKKILDMGYINQTDLAEKLGKTQSTIANKLRLLNLCDEVQEALLEGKISERHARSLLKLKNDDQVKLLNRIIEERMTVRKTDEEIKKLLEAPNSLKLEKTEEKQEINSEKELEVVDIFDDDTTEVVSLDEEENDNKEGEDKMNQDMNNNFNPFMNQQINNENSQTISAPDINNQINQPMSNNLNENGQNLINVTNTMVPETSTQGDSTQGGNKFSNLFQNKSENNSNYVEDLESKEVNMNFAQPAQNPTFQFNAVDSSIFNSQSNANQIPSEPIQNDVQPAMSQPEPTLNNNVFTDNQINNSMTPPIQPEPQQQISQPDMQPENNPFTQPLVNNSIEPVQNSMPEPTSNSFMSQPTVSDNSQNIGTPDLNNTINSSPFAGQPQNVNTVNNMFTPQSNENIQPIQPEPQQTISQPDIQTGNNPFAAPTTNEIPQPVNDFSNPTPVNTQPQMEQDLINNQVQPFSLDDTEEFVGQGSAELVPPNPFTKNEYSTNEEPPVVVSNEQIQGSAPQVDLKTVINTIRECADKIEKYGYAIDTEEIDFEDSYQVIFKIEK